MSIFSDIKFPTRLEFDTKFPTALERRFKRLNLFLFNRIRKQKLQIILPSLGIQRKGMKVCGNSYTMGLINYFSEQNLDSYVIRILIEVTIN